MKIKSLTMIGIALLFFLCSQGMPPDSAAAEAATDIGANFACHEIARGVYAVIRKDPPGLMCDGNSGFIIAGDHVVVVDAPESTAAVIAALKKITAKPVKYVINTHWHDDHIIGNDLYKRQYPGVRFIAHEKARAYLPAQGLRNRQSMLKTAPEGLAYIKTLLQKNESFGGGPLADEERESLASDVKLVEQYLEVVPKAEIILPDLTPIGTMTLASAGRTIQIKSVGSGHTGGDIIVYLPREKILFSGDLVIWPVPLVGQDQSCVLEWGSTLERLIALRPARIVPGHGRVLNDISYMQLLARLFLSIRQQTEKAYREGKTLAEARQAVELDEFKRQIAGDSKLKRLLFDYYVSGPSLAAAYRQLAERNEAEAPAAEN